MEKGEVFTRCGLLSSIGLGLNLIWCTLMGHTIGFYVSAAGLGAIVNPRTFFLLGILIIGIVFVALPRLLRKRDYIASILLPMISAVGTAGFALAFHQDVLNARWLAVGGLLIAGFGYLWIVARFTLLLTRTQSFPCVVCAIAGAQVIRYAVMIPMGTLFDSEAQVLTAIAVPLLAALVFRFARRAAAVGAGDGASRRTIFGVPSRCLPVEHAPAEKRNLLVILVVAAVLLAAVRSFSNYGFWGNTFADIDPVPPVFEIVIVAASVVLFAWLFILKMESFSLTTRFQPAMLVVIAGLLVVTIEATQGYSAPLYVVVQIDEMLAHVLFWVAVAVALNIFDMPSYRVIGIPTVIYAGCSVLWVVVLGQTNPLDGMIALTVAYGVTVAAMYVSLAGRSRRAAARGEGSSAVEGTEVGKGDTLAADESLNRTIRLHCERIAGEYGFSPREKEVFLLLAQGRSGAFICDELAVAPSTVKTHITHIYTKLGVHDRQEMMDAVWGHETR